jgi:hypothetical protein
MDFIGCELRWLTLQRGATSLSSQCSGDARYGVRPGNTFVTFERSRQRRPSERVLRWGRQAATKNDAGTYPIVMSMRILAGSDLGFSLLQAAPTTQLASLRVIAAIVLVVMICGVLYVLRNLKNLRAEIRPSEMIGRRGRDRTMIFIGCAMAFVVICLLLFLVAKA